MPLGAVFAVSFLATFALLLGVFVLGRRVLRRRRAQSFERLMRVRATLYAQMNALLGEFQRLSRIDREARVEAVRPEPRRSPTGQLVADVTERLRIAVTDVDPDGVPKALLPSAVALDEAIRVLLQGLEAVLASETPEAFVENLPSAAPTVNSEQLRKADGELRAVAEAEGLLGEEHFYHDSSFYV